MTRGRKPGCSTRSFMLVTNDKYEFPLSKPMSLEEMAAYINKSKRYVTYAATPSATAKRKQFKNPTIEWAIVAFREDEDCED